MANTDNFMQQVQSLERAHEQYLRAYTRDETEAFKEISAALDKAVTGQNNRRKAAERAFNKWRTA